jgi:hypothetical protein
MGKIQYREPKNEKDRKSIGLDAYGFRTIGFGTIHPKEEA